MTCFITHHNSIIANTEAQTDMGAWNKLFNIQPQLANHSIKALNSLGYKVKKTRKENDTTKPLSS